MRHATRCAALLIAVLVAGCAAFKETEGLRGVVSPDAPVERVRDGFARLDAPLPVADGGLLFSDVRAQRLYKLDINGTISTFRDKADATVALAYLPGGTLIAAEAGARRISVSDRHGNASELTRGDGERPLAALEDLIATDRGGVYFIDAGAGAARRGYVYYLPPGAKRARIVEDTLARPAGVAFTVDAKTLLVSDAAAPSVYAYDVARDGTLARKRTFAALRDLKPGQESGAGGMAVDREGRVFVTTVTGIQMFDAKGEYLGTIPTPQRATNLAFSGPGKGTLYITAGDTLFRVRMLTRGPARVGK